MAVVGDGRWVERLLTPACSFLLLLLLFFYFFSVLLIDYFDFLFSDWLVATVGW